MLFLIEYDRSRGSIVQFREFDDNFREIAEDARLDLELELNRQGVEHEIVLLDAPSEEALRRTHSRYFESVAELACGSPETQAMLMRTLESSRESKPGPPCGSSR
jgi:hypothetical protein